MTELYAAKHTRRAGKSGLQLAPSPVRAPTLAHLQAHDRLRHAVGWSRETSGDNSAM